MKDRPGVRRRSFLGVLGAGISGLLFGSGRAEARRPLLAPPAPAAADPVGSPSVSNGIVPEGITAPAPAPTRFASRMMLPFSSLEKVAPGQKVRISARNGIAACRFERLIIGNIAADWYVDDIRVGGHSCLRAPVWGGKFSSYEWDMDRMSSLPIAGENIDIEIDVRYIGDDPSGECFVAGMLGSLVR